MKEKSKETKIIGFEHFEHIEPSDLITFSEEYKRYQKYELIPELDGSHDRDIDLIIARMENDGTWGKKIVTGTIIEMYEDGFSFFTSSNYYEEHEKPIEMFISFKNVLGDVPMLADAPDDLNPFEFNDKDFPLMYYFKKLEKMKKLLESCIGVIHHAKLFFRYDENHQDRREGDFYIDCEIQKVNKSNVEINHLRSFAFVNKNRSYADLVERDKIQRFISPECYLYKVVVHYGSKCEINPHDEE